MSGEKFHQSKKVIAGEAAAAAALAGAGIAGYVKLLRDRRRRAETEVATDDEEVGRKLNTRIRRQADETFEHINNPEIYREQLKMFRDESIDPTIRTTMLRITACVRMYNRRDFRVPASILEVYERVATDDTVFHGALQLLEAEGIVIHQDETPSGFTVSEAVRWHETEGREEDAPGLIDELYGYYSAE